MDPYGLPASTVNPGELTIYETDEALTVTLAGATHVYDGETYKLAAATTNAKSGTTTIEYSADGVNWTDNVESLTATTVAESKTISVRATNPNYANPATNSAARRPPANSAARPTTSTKASTILNFPTRKKPCWKRSAALSTRSS